MHNPFTTFPLISSLLEWSTFVSLAVFHGGLAVTEAISQSDWARLTGEHGAIFVLSIVGLAFWGKSHKDDKSKIKEDLARERRHAEALAASDRHFGLLMEMNKQNADDLKDLSIQSIKANLRGTAEIALLRIEIKSLAKL